MSIMVRAKISAAEWIELRKIALDVESPVAAIVGDLIRDYLRVNGYVEADGKAVAK